MNKDINYIPDAFTFISDSIFAKYVLSVQIKEKKPEDVVYDNWSYKDMGYALSRETTLDFIKNYPDYFKEDYRLRQLEEFLKLYPQTKVECRPKFVERFIQGYFE